MSSKVVFLDIDGTITNFNGDIPEKAVEALRMARENGHDLVICTGRTVTQIYPWLLETGCFSGIIAGAGAYVEKDGEVLYSLHMTREERKTFVSYMEQLGCTYFLQAVSGVYATEKVMEQVLENYRQNGYDPKERERLLGKVLLTENPMALEDINKAAFYQADASLEEIRINLGQAFTVTASSFVLSDTTDGEITLAGCDKGEGMRIFLEKTGKKKEDTIAVGDGPNDLEMLDFAAVGVAMGNACEELKIHADLITDSVNEDGLYKAFEKLGLFGE